MLEKQLSQIVQQFEKEKEVIKFQSQVIVKQQDEDIVSKLIIARVVGLAMNEGGQS